MGSFTSGQQKSFLRLDGTQSRIYCPRSAYFRVQALGIRAHSISSWSPRTRETARSLCRAQLPPASPPSNPLSRLREESKRTHSSTFGMQLCRKQFKVWTRCVTSKLRAKLQIVSIGTVDRNQISI